MHMYMCTDYIRFSPSSPSPGGSLVHVKLWKEMSGLGSAVAVQVTLVTPISGMWMTGEALMVTTGETVGCGKKNDITERRASLVFISFYMLTLYNDIQNGLVDYGQVWSASKAKILSGVSWHDAVDHQSSHGHKGAVVCDIVVSNFAGALIFRKVDSWNRVTACTATDVQAFSSSDNFIVMLSVYHRGS